MNPKLSVNLGLRYDFITPALEAQQPPDQLRPRRQRQRWCSPRTARSRTAAWSSRTGTTSRRASALVYKLDDKTLVRGGYGHLLQPVRPRRQRRPARAEPARAASTTTHDAAPITAPLFLLREGFPAGFLNPPNLDPAAGDLRAVRIRAVSQRRAEDDDAAGQRRRCSASWSRDVVLVGRRRLHEGHEPGDARQPEPAAAQRGRQQRARPAALSELRLHRVARRRTATPNYKGVDLGLEKRFSSGYGFGVAYTLGDSKDNTSEHLTTQGSNAFPQNARDLERVVRAERLRRPPPPGRELRRRAAVRQEQRLGSAARSGRLVGPASTPRARAGRSRSTRAATTSGTNMTGLPNVDRRSRGPEDGGSVVQPGGFQAVPSGTFGNEQRNQPARAGLPELRHEPRSGTSASAAASSATLRWDIFNVFNTANFGLPNRNISDAATFGDDLEPVGRSRASCRSRRASLSKVLGF